MPAMFLPACLPPQVKTQVQDGLGRASLTFGTFGYDIAAAAALHFNVPVRGRPGAAREVGWAGLTVRHRHSREDRGGRDALADLYSSLSGKVSIKEPPSAGDGRG